MCWRGAATNVGYLENTAYVWKSNDSIKIPYTLTRDLLNFEDPGISLSSQDKSCTDHTVSSGVYYTPRKQSWGVYRNHPVRPSVRQSVHVPCKRNSSSTAYWIFMKLYTFVIHHLQIFMKEYDCCPKFKGGDNSTYTFTKRGGGHVPCKRNSY